MDRERLHEIPTAAVESDEVYSNRVSSIREENDEFLENGLEKFHLDSMDSDECSNKPKIKREEYTAKIQPTEAMPKRSWKLSHLYGDNDLDMETIREIGRRTGAIPRRFLRKLYGMEKKSPPKKKILSDDESDWNSQDDTLTIHINEETEIKKNAKLNKPPPLHIGNRTYNGSPRTKILPGSRNKITITFGNSLRREYIKKSNVIEIDDLSKTGAAAPPLSYEYPNEDSEPDTPPPSERSYEFYK